MQVQNPSTQTPRPLSASVRFTDITCKKKTNSQWITTVKTNSRCLMLYVCILCNISNHLSLSLFSSTLSVFWWIIGWFKESVFETSRLKRTQPLLSGVFLTGNNSKNQIHEKRKKKTTKKKILVLAAWGFGHQLNRHHCHQLKKKSGITAVHIWLS